jgi:hypothetical protein
MSTFNASIAANGDDGSLTDAAEDWLDGGGIVIGNDGSPVVGVLRFVNVTIPAGSTINTAVITLYGGTGALTGNYSLKAMDEDNSAQVTNWADGNGRPRTTAAVTGNIGASGTVTLTDCTAVVQEVIDRGGWSSGNALQFYVGDVNQNTTATFSDKNGAGTEPSIAIDYTEPSGPAPAVLSGLFGSPLLNSPLVR